VCDIPYVLTTDPQQEADIEYGTKIGKFVVVGELGSGGMGVVYAAHDRELDRKVALKVMRASTGTDEDRMRMLREGQAMARITHPNVITVFEVGTEGGIVFLAQELLDGGTLARWLEFPRTQPLVLDMFLAAGRGLAAAHAAGLVHRDFKPDNVLLGKDGRVRVSDFGLARPLGPDGVAVTRAHARPGGDVARSPMAKLTETGAVMGTPLFMAPEQHNGERADERSDQFSFCVALYHALYGDWPFAGQTAVALADNVIHGRIQRPPKGRRIPARLRDILLRGLSTEPAARYPSMEALLADIAVKPPRRLRTLALVAVVLGVLGAGGFAASRLLHEEDPAGPSWEPPTLQVTPDPSQRTNEWLVGAIETGQLDDAIDKLEMAAPLAQAKDPVHASIAWSAGAFALVQRGRLADAKTLLANAGAPADPTAAGYADLAAAAIAATSGAHAEASDHAGRCMRALSGVLAATCARLHAETAADRDDLDTARAEYRHASEVAKQANSDAQALSIDLEIAELDVVAGQPQQAQGFASLLQAKARDRGMTSQETEAWIVIARTQLAQAATQDALESLKHIKPEAIQVLRVRLDYEIVLGETTALLDDHDGGLAAIDQARAEADKAGFVGLAFEARLAHVETLVALSAPEAQAEQAALVKDARAAGYTRIARLAETAQQR
jgi:hypothetical protein